MKKIVKQIVGFIVIIVFVTMARELFTKSVPTKYNYSPVRGDQVDLLSIVNRMCDFNLNGIEDTPAIRSLGMEISYHSDIDKKYLKECYAGYYKFIVLAHHDILNFIQNRNGDTSKFNWGTRTQLYRDSLKAVYGCLNVDKFETANDTLLNKMPYTLSRKAIKDFVELAHLEELNILIRIDNNYKILLKDSLKSISFHL